MQEFPTVMAEGREAEALTLILGLVNPSHPGDTCSVLHDTHQI